MGYSNPPFGMPNYGTPGSFVWPEVFRNHCCPIFQLPEDIFSVVKHGDGKSPLLVLDWTILGI